jgi:hypothetical protein
VVIASLRALVRRTTIPTIAAAVGASALLGATSGSAAATAASTTKARHACNILLASEIESVLSAAPLDPGPTKVHIPNSRRNFTRCEWDDRREPTTTQLAVYTGLARKLTRDQRLRLGIPAAGTTARALTPQELDGLGDWGAVEIIRDGTYGSIQVVRGAASFFVSSSYQGPGPLPLVSEADMIALARKAAPRI